VAAQAVLLVAFFLTPRRHDWSLPGWLAAGASMAVVAGGAILLLAALNLGRSLTALPTPASRGELQTGGLYRFVRHPIYSGLLLLLFGSTAGSGSVVRFTLACALLGLLTRKAQWEEDMLRRRYPGYDDYARRTPRFVPHLRRAPWGT
jgi:protein-S-isoprenylcysteine O-methyltransferase Ste14